MSIKITVEGHLTKAPELRKTPSGKSVTRFDLAHNFVSVSARTSKTSPRSSSAQASGKKTALPKWPSSA
jgi:single-stranded DNA-binding protein